MYGTKVNEIIDNLYLSNRAIAGNPEHLEFNKITHVLTTALEIDFSKLYSNLKIKYKKIPADDYDSFNYKIYFDEMSDFINESLLDQGKILVHCAVGASRSPTAIIAYLIKYKDMSMEDALILVKKKRPLVHPNDGFIQQLKDYEKELKNLNITKTAEEVKTNLEEKSFFRCNGCRTQLFQSVAIIHGGQTKKCTSYFIERPSWIDDLEERADKDKLYCFNKKCGQKIGEMSLMGIKCSCKEWISPGYQLHKSKLDFIEVLLK